MSKSLVFALIYILISFALIILQSTFLAPRRLGVLSPDFNLIMTLFPAIYQGIKGGTALALANCYIMDVMSGNAIGVHILSRMGVFVIIHRISNNVYHRNSIIQALLLFTGTLASWGFIYTVILMETEFDFQVSLGKVIVQGISNSTVGLLIFQLLDKINERVQR
ncbi:MAG: hypothetical protein KatS3mg078_2173 [Deltaproteobacteria bacterium]|jgi:rod shape-determining protein MreD|nr:MAG: hypothetical protein KatS3mg078_2173 [Deltaproteobacteria bacterium]